MPTHSQVVAVMTIAGGATRADVLHLLRSVQDLTGSRESPRDDGKRDRIGDSAEDDG